GAEFQRHWGVRDGGDDGVQALAVDQLHRGTERVRRGDFTYRVRIRSQDQMRELAESFNEMASGIDRLLMEEKEKQRLEEELRIARSIQLRLLPPDTRQCGPFDIAAVNVPAQEIAGDYFDYFYGPEHQLSVLVADVSGKGASAAFYMAELKGVINHLQSSGLTPSEIILECHRSLMPTFDRVTFVTMNLARFDVDSHTLVYARAGHTPALFYEAASGTCRELTPKGLAIGLSALTGGGTQEVSLPYRTGDILFFFSDGLSELADPDGEMFGVERIREVLERSAGESASEIRQRMLDESIAFARNAANKDDMTFLIVRCT
ncbi:MAG TPA: SpoIIE family protein phosphatase, partial [Candidatus Aminicenantes bacterium]|nr:SpoIIE family protein phosphatase [Candidatus Aminicenantes bacterium]